MALSAGSGLRVVGNGRAARYTHNRLQHASTSSFQGLHGQFQLLPMYPGKSNGLEMLVALRARITLKLPTAGTIVGKTMT